MSSPHQHINLKSGNGLKRLIGTATFLLFSRFLSLSYSISSSPVSLTICSYILFSFTSEKRFFHHQWYWLVFEYISMFACIVVYDSYVNGSHHNGSWYIGERQINPPFRWQLEKAEHVKKEKTNYGCGPLHDVFWYLYTVYDIFLLYMHVCVSYRRIYIVCVSLFSVVMEDDGF